MWGLSGLACSAAALRMRGRQMRRRLRLKPKRAKLNRSRLSRRSRLRPRPRLILHRERKSRQPKPGRSVRNDVTGKWRVLVFYSAENIVDHATEYYNTYFSSDDEIHIAVNLGLKTTSVMNVSGGVMSIGVHEYIDKEEHDAKVLGGGELLKSYTVNLETGETEDVSAE